MSGNLERLRKGERWWTAEIVLRVLGLALLAGFDQIVLLMHRLVMASPLHHTTMGEIAICVAGVLLLAAGLALALEGPGLFRVVSTPTAPALP